jgi:hypothetical protein
VEGPPRGDSPSEERSAVKGKISFVATNTCVAETDRVRDTSLGRKPNETDHETNVDDVWFVVQGLGWRKAIDAEDKDGHRKD